MMVYNATFDENRRAVGMLDPTRDKKMKAHIGVEKGRHLCPEEMLRVKPPICELGWKVKVMTKKKNVIVAGTPNGWS